MISSQHHPQVQDYAGDSATEAYNVDSTSVTEEQQQQDYQQEQNNSRCMMLLHDMRGQIEFYFGVNNYTRDTYLQQVVSTHQGSVPISVIAQFPKIQQLYHGMMQYFYANNPTFVAPIEVMVCRSLAPSRLIDVSNDGYFLRPNWMLLQDPNVTASHSHVSSTDAFNNASGQYQVIKANGMIHTDATNTTVSPTSFASGSDGSVGLQSSGGDAVVNAKLQLQPTPVMFNPTGGVYYVPPPQAYHYPVYNATGAYHHHPSMGVMTSGNVPHSYPVAASFYRPNMEPNGQFYMPHHQYALPQPYPHYFNQPPPSMHQGMVYLDAPTTNEQYSKNAPPLSFPANTEGSNQRSMPSTGSLNAPPSVIRLQDPFHDDTVQARNFHQPQQQQQQQQAGRKKNKSRLKRQTSSSDNSSRNEYTGRSGLPNGHDSKRSSPPPNSSQQDESQATLVDTSARYTATTGTNHTKPDDTSTDGNSRTGTSIPKKEKNRVSGSHQHRPTSRPTTSQSSNHRGTRGSGKNRLNSNNKLETALAVKKETNLLIDENFPSLTTGVNFLPVEKTESKNTLAEDIKKKKYAEALLHNPGIPTAVSTQPLTVDTVESSEAAAAKCVAGDVHTEVPAVTNLLDKFNLHK